MDTSLRVTLFQYDIAWEDKLTNLAYIEKQLENMADETDIIILPEMFSTGFSMNSHALAEETDGATISQLKVWATKYDVAFCGSFIASDGELYFNRGFFITPDKAYYYDKRHLFRLGGENEHFSAGKTRLIFEHKGFNICLLICYDLRFPVWARNTENAYDLLIYVANWPSSRANVWNTLLTARAIENVCYVCGVNRIGKDGHGLMHQGESKLINAKGEIIYATELNQMAFHTVPISKNELNRFRAKFPVWKDADTFELQN